MIQREPGSPEDAVVQWLDSKAHNLGEVLIHLVNPVINHPYFAVAVLAAVVYLLAARKGKRRR